MSVRPESDALLDWALSLLGAKERNSEPGLSVVAGDASSRKYFRFEAAGRSYVVAHAPPETENNGAFLAVRDLLAASDVRVPALYGVDMDRGYLLLEDLGDRLLLPALDKETAEAHYTRAFDVLLQLSAVDTTRAGLRAYDAEILNEELGRFPEWFAAQLLGYSPAGQELALFQALSARLVSSALEQPQVLVHRDFHSRNLMLLADDSLAVIDFQDAVVGPVTYDAVSLLRDCYKQWPAMQVEAWASTFAGHLRSRGLLAADDLQFHRWFDWMGLQRHIKVLGTFARLAIRDGKSAYLDDLPLVIHYVEHILDKYAAEEPEFRAFQGWFSDTLTPLIRAQDWSSPG